MGVVIKQSIKSSIFSYIGVVIGYVNVLWLYPFYLSADQIGLFKLIQSSAYLMATFGQFGLGSSLVKFYPELKEEKGFLSLILIGGSIGFVIISTLALIFQQPLISYFSTESAHFVEYFQLTLFITLFLVLFQLLEAYCRSILSIVTPTILRDIGIRLLTMLFIILYGLSVISFEQLVMSLLVIYVVICGLLLAMLLYQKKAFISLRFSFLNKTLTTRIIRYGIYAVLGAGGTQIILQIDSIMVSGSLGLTETGIYTIAFFIGTVIEIPKRAIAQLSLSLMSQSFQKGDMKAVKKLYQQTSINQFVIGSLLLLGIWANLENIYHFVPNGEIYEGGFYVVLFIGLGKLSDMLFGANGEIIVMSPYYRFNVLAVSFLALVTIGLNLWLIPQFGIRGAAISSFSAMALFNLVKYLFVWIKFKIQPFNSSTLKAVLVVVLCYGLHLLINPLSSPLFDLILRSLAILSLFTFLTISLKVSQEIDGLFKKGIALLSRK